MVFGFLAVWIFRRTADVAEVQRAVKRIQARLLEFRLFYEEPGLVWQAQKAIFRENLRFLLLIARPLILLTLPTIWIWIQLEAVYSYGPLRVGEASVVTVQLSQPVQGDDAAALVAPPEIAIETEPVRSLTDRQISWRIRPLRAVVGSFHLSYRNAIADKTIAAETRSLWLVRERTRDLWAYLMQPEEARLPPGAIQSIAVEYPSADVVLAGIRLPWMIWFVVISSLSALVFARWIRI